MPARVCFSVRRRAPAYFSFEHDAAVGQLRALKNAALHGVERAVMLFAPLFIALLLLHLLCHFQRIYIARTEASFPSA